MVRRVGFGDPPPGRRPEQTKGAGGTRSLRLPTVTNRNRPAGAAAAAADASIAADASAAGDARRAGVIARMVIAVFLLFWLAAWSNGIVIAWSAVSEIWARLPGDWFDWAVLLFFAVWLSFALVGWAFGVVILVVMLFGKPARGGRLERLQRLRARRRVGE